MPKEVIMIGDDNRYLNGPDKGQLAHSKSYEETQLKIEEAYLELAKKNPNRAPMIKEIAEVTGYQPITVSKHLSEIRLKELKPKQRIMMEKVLTKLSELAIGGDMRAIALYLKVVGEWVERTEVVSDGAENKVLKIEFSNGKNVNIDKQLVMNQTTEEPTDENQ